MKGSYPKLYVDKDLTPSIHVLFKRKEDNFLDFLIVGFHKTAEPSLMVKQRIPSQELTHVGEVVDPILRLLGNLSFDCLILEVKKSEGIGVSKRTIPSLSQLTTKRWSVAVADKRRRCFFANLESSEIRELKDLQTHRSCESNLTGSLHRISIRTSNGRVGCFCCCLLLVVVVSSVI
jgi:hypothetical protein